MHGKCIVCGKDAEEKSVFCKGVLSRTGLKSLTGLISEGLSDFTFYKTLISGFKWINYSNPCINFTLR